MAAADLTAERLREVLDYDRASGVFTNRMRRRVNGAAAGAASGHTRKDGYILIGVDRRIYFAHRLAWLYVYGAWPVHHIDHIDGNPSNNRLENLRDVPQRTNVENQRIARSDSGTGFLGVSRSGNRFAARIEVRGHKVHIGYFATPEEASAAYVEQKRKLHAGCSL